MIEALIAYPDEVVLEPQVRSLRVPLADRRATTIHVASFDRRFWRPRVEVFEEPTRLLDHCEDKGIDYAMVGGYDLNHTGVLLGDYWTDGEQRPSVPIGRGYGGERGALYISEDSEDVEIGARRELPAVPDGDLMQAGPVLVKDGKVIVKPGVHPEGFGKTREQFAPPPTEGRHPRAAFGFNDEYMVAMVSEGRTFTEAGLTIYEEALIMKALGARHVINVDGGSSTTLIAGQELQNRPVGQEDNFFVRGQFLKSALIFERV